MKINTPQKILIALGASLIPFITVQAGEVATEFTTGETLTATRMEEVRSAINDNDARTTTNETAISTNSTDIGTNTTNIATNTADISDNNIAITSMFSGDGSAGPLTITENTNWVSNPPAIVNFTDCTIETGITFQVPPGTTIRCSGNFTNDGSIIVTPQIAGTSPTTWGSGPSAEIYGIGHAGDTIQAASGGSYDNDGATDAQTLRGGFGGTAIPVATASSSFKGFRFGGGSGGGFGGDGEAGGLLKIFVGGSITNNSTISANGTGHCCQGGGGGGGIVVLAAVDSVTNSATGTIEANGGNGANSRSFGGAGGGGGGGIVIFVSPTIDNSGTVNVLGGTAGTTTSNVTSNTRLGGGGGGASGGDGGNGGQVSGDTTGIPSAAVDGEDGYVLEINANPAFM